MKSFIVLSFSYFLLIGSSIHVLAEDYGDEDMVYIEPMESSSPHYSKHRTLTKTPKSRKKPEYAFASDDSVESRVAIELELSNEEEEDPYPIRTTEKPTPTPATTLPPGRPDNQGESNEDMSSEGPGGDGENGNDMYTEGPGSPVNPDGDNNGNGDDMDYEGPGSSLTPGGDGDYPGPDIYDLMEPGNGTNINDTYVYPDIPDVPAYEYPDATNFEEPTPPPKPVYKPIDIPREDLFTFGVSDEDKLSGYLTLACKGGISSFQDQNAQNESFDTFREKDLLELAFLNLAYDLTGDTLTQLTGGNSWRKPVLEVISSIAKQTCSDSVVPKGYINTVRNLYLYYWQKKSNYVGDEKEDTPKVNEEKKSKQWDRIIKLLKKCSRKVTLLNIDTNCDQPTTVKRKTGEKETIRYPLELLDDKNREYEYEHGEEVMEGIWMLFSTTFARCSSITYPHDRWIATFYEMFIQDFINPFHRRWDEIESLGKNIDLIFGPVDLKKSKENMRYCTAAAYMYEDKFDDILVRPVKVYDGLEISENAKTGLFE